MELKYWLEGAMAFLMLTAVGGVVWDRFIKRRRGIGVRVIQFLAVAFLLPGIIILGLEQILGSQAVATLFGTVAGYTLSGIGKDEPKRNSN